MKVKKLTKELTPRQILNATLKDLDDLKAQQVVTLNVKHLSPMMDYMVVATGNSSRHVQSIAEHLQKQMKERNVTTLNNIDYNDEWILVDLGEIIVHIMQSQARDFYSIEKLWSMKPTKTRCKVPMINA